MRGVFVSYMLCAIVTADYCFGIANTGLKTPVQLSGEFVFLPQI